MSGSRHFPPLPKGLFTRLNVIRVRDVGWKWYLIMKSIHLPLNTSTLILQGPNTASKCHRSHRPVGMGESGELLQLGDEDLDYDLGGNESKDGGRCYCLGWGYIERSEGQKRTEEGTEERTL